VYSRSPANFCACGHGCGVGGAASRVPKPHLDFITLCTKLIDILVPPKKNNMSDTRNTSYVFQN
jgi:hypothetical protein